MKVLDFIYNGTTISFEPTGSDNVMVNATEMGKVFNETVEHFTRLDSTKKFIETCLKNPYMGYLNIENEEDLIVSRQKSGTWMHRILALKFAAWLDPAFELWVWMTVDSIILGHFKAVKEATFEKFQAEKDFEDLKDRLMVENPEALKAFLEFNSKVSSADQKRLKALKAATDQLKFEFETKK